MIYDWFSKVIGGYYGQRHGSHAYFFFNSGTNDFVIIGSSKECFFFLFRELTLFRRFPLFLWVTDVSAFILLWILEIVCLEMIPLCPAWHRAIKHQKFSQSQKISLANKNLLVLN